MWYLILTILIGIYILIHQFLTGDFTSTYIIQPILWLTLAITTIIIANQEGQNILKFKKVRRWYLGKTPTHAGLMLGGFHIALLIFAGIMFGFGTSPYSHSPAGIARNAFFVTTLLIGTEISRAYLIKKGSKTKKYTTLTIVLTTILFLIISITPQNFSKLLFTNPEQSLQFLGATLITALAINLLASYLSYLGGAMASIPYMGAIMAFEWFSPLLPNPHWTILALIGTIAPALGFIVIQNAIEPFIEIKKHKTHRRKQTSRQGWTIIAIFGLIMVFFSYGYMGVTPTVIYSGSMQPEYQVGDMVIVDEVSADEIQKGDVIQFVRHETTIMHRVIDIQTNQDGEKIFIVKGDANDEPDSDPVTAQQIKGEAVFNIPKIGWLQIYVKETIRNFQST